MHRRISFGRVVNLLTLSSAEFAEALAAKPGVIIPIGSIEQHGPMGLLGCDTLCAETVAQEAGTRGKLLVAPVLAYTSAQFNMDFPGTISVRSRTLMSLIEDIVDSLHHQGVKGVYFLNAHGANIAPIRSAMHDIYSRLGDSAPRIRCRSWWDFDAVNVIREREFGDWEGMHATPSEISITQKYHRTPDVIAAEEPERKLDAAFIQNHAGDFHPPAAQHKAEFPDGRVGAHSALASPDAGAAIVDAAATALIDDFNAFMHEIPPRK
jgi:creatinine amidohydrolase